jgi:uncharacterized UPF0160 family protein
MSCGFGVGTHSGSFHCDEALACYLLVNHTVEYRDAKIIRSRDPAVLKTLPILVDVGGVYDPNSQRFDHHQRGFTEVFGGKFTTKLSSAGLIYKHFGREIVARLTQLTGADLNLVYERVYENFIEGVDGIDNGVLRYPSDVKAAYKVNSDLGARVGRLNAAWNETTTDAELDARFQQVRLSDSKFLKSIFFDQAMAIAGEEFLAEVNSSAKIWLPAREIVASAVDQRFTVHPSGEIIALERYTVWASHIYKLEALQDVKTPIKYVLYCDSSGAWRIQVHVTDK